MCTVKKTIFVSAIIGLMNVSSFAATGIVGYLETTSGNKYLVTGENYESVEIASINKKDKRSIRLNSEFCVFGDNFKDLDSEVKFNAKYLRVDTKSEYKFYVPVFGTKFMKDTAKIYIEGVDGNRRHVLLPVEGGSIKGIKVLKDGVELLVFEQKTYTKQDKDGKTLYGVGHGGKNVKITLKMNKAGGNNSSVLWVDGDSVYKYTEGKIRKEDSKK